MGRGITCDICGEPCGRLWESAGVRVCGVPRPAWGLQGLDGLRDRPLRAEGSRVAISRAGRPRAGRGQPVLPKNSHVISLGQFLMCLENVGIATTRFQSLKYGSGNYVRDLWGTMWVCGEPCACGQERAGPAPAGATVPPRKLARNFPWSVFDMAGKRWNCNGQISKFE